jgi:indoleamine 2,3-dioxygenase
MLPPLPKLDDYGISPNHGFLPDRLPMSHLPDPYYNRWESIVANLQALILSRRLRALIDAMPILSTVGLEDEAEWRRAYMMLAFMAHGYIWGGDEPAERLPPSVSVPLLEISGHLEVPPVATYAAVCLWNFKPLFLDGEIDDLTNLATLLTFTGSLDESWFYLVSVAIEARGGPIIPLMLTAIDAARRDDAEIVTHCLESFAERLLDLGELLQRMNDNCDPHVFYHHIRTFLAGSKNMAEAGLPNGVIYDTGSGKDGYTQLSGGSNAQSSLIQFFDLVLGIEHRPTGEKADDASKKGLAQPPKNNFIHEMRKYMPGPHRRFLEHVGMVANIRDFVSAHPHDQALCAAYDGCLASLTAFRQKHLNIVTRYVVLRSRERPTWVRSDAVQKRKNIAASSTNNKEGKDKLKGTGGTALVSFLKQARDETSEPAVTGWMREKHEAALRRSYRASEKERRVGSESESEFQVNGLAGSWAADWETNGSGGLCHY